MPNRRIDPNLCQAIVQCLEDGNTVRHTVQHYPEASERTIRNTQRCLRATGKPYLGAPFGRIGRPPKISPEILTDLLELLTYRPTLYLEELEYHCLAAQRDEPRRTGFYLGLAQYRDYQLVYLDESAFNEKTYDRKYGWSPRGVPAEDIRHLHKSPRWSVLPALSCEGFLDGTLIMQGAVTGEIFCT